jgi:hypothetical protein
MELFKKKDSGAVNNPASSQPQKPAGGMGGFFSSTKPAQPPQVNGATSQPTDMNMLVRRLRINEERAMNIRKKAQMIEHNMIINHRKLLGEIKFINDEVSEMKRDFEELKAYVKNFSRELQECAKKEDVQVLERYINMWQPVNFVTRREVERLINEILDERSRPGK